VVLFLAGSLTETQAASVGFVPAENVLNIADEIDLSIVGSAFLDEAGERLAGGTIDFSYDPGVIEIMGVTVNETLFAFDPQPGTDDDGDGIWGTLGFDRDLFATAASGNFTIATITIRAIGPGVSDFTILNTSFFGSDESPGNVFGQELFPAITTARITVVPIPAAVWLFISGFLGLSALGQTRAPNAVRFSR